MNNVKTSVNELIEKTQPQKFTYFDSKIMDDEQNDEFDKIGDFMKSGNYEDQLFES